MLPRKLTRKTTLPWIMCGLSALFYCYEYFLRISPSVMAPDLMRAYDLTGAQVGNLSAFYYHAYVPMQILVGLLMDSVGPRRLLSLACLLCAVGSYLFAATHSLWVAQLGRFLVGFGSAFAFVGALKLATIWLPPNRFALMSGIIMALGMAGAMVGDVLLRSMVDAIGWVVTVYASAVGGVLLTLFLWLILKDVSSDNHVRYEKITFQQLMSGLSSSFRNRQIWFVGIVGFLLYISLAVFAELWGIPYLEQARGLSPVYAASANSMIFLGWGVGGPLWGWISDRIGRRCLPMMIGSAVSFFLACVLFYSSHLSLTALYFLLFTFGLFSGAQILIFAICCESVSTKISGTAISLVNTIVMIGGSLSQPLVGKLLDLSWDGQMVDGARFYSVLDYQIALSVIPICILLAFGLIFFVRDGGCH